MKKYTQFHVYVFIWEKETRHRTERRFFLKTADNRMGTCWEYEASNPCCRYAHGQTLPSQEPPHTSVQSRELGNNTESPGLLSEMAIVQLISVTRQTGTWQIYLYGLVKASCVITFPQNSFWDSCQIKIECHDTMFIYASVISALIYMILVKFYVFHSADTFLLHVWSIKFISMKLSDKKAFCSAFLNRVCVLTHFPWDMRVHKTSEAPGVLLASFQTSLS